MNEQLLSLTERYLGARSTPREKPAFDELAKALKTEARTGEAPEVESALRQIIHPSLGYTAAQTLHKIVRRLHGRGYRPGRPVRLAVLGSCTTNQLVTFLELHLFAMGLAAEIYEADYGVLHQEILDPSSGLHSFRPEFVFLATDWRDIADAPELAAPPARVQECLSKELERWHGLWSAAHSHLTCQVIQNNFTRPSWRTLGNHEAAQPSSLGGFIARLNIALQDKAPSYVTIHDADHLASAQGRQAWGDERFYHHAKLPCAPDCLVDYAHSVAALIGAQLGLAKKCLVLDLDNTLWGGVVGDHGVANLRIGRGDAEAEAFTAFQEYVKRLESRGVILAVCSANEDENARAPFLQHPEMVLRLEDIACFRANWRDKASNIASIARELNIGTDSMVFVDDNPTERSLVRRLLPEVLVPEMPADPSLYIRALDELRCFETGHLAAEDSQRTVLYRANALRKQQESAFEDLDAFLASLEMRAVFEPIGEENLDRCVQLINKTNQFNLTTRRYSHAQVRSMAADSRWVSLALRLEDRFGDTGLISVVLARREDGCLTIDTWLMSCRVLRRGVEKLVLNKLCEIAAGDRLHTIRGEYLPTAKNKLVANLFADLGFRLTHEDGAGATRWELSVETERTALTHHIEEVEVHV